MALYSFHCRWVITFKCQGQRTMTAWHLFWHPRHVVSIISADQRQLPQLLRSTKIWSRIGKESWISVNSVEPPSKFSSKFTSQNPLQTVQIVETWTMNSSNKEICAGKKHWLDPLDWSQGVQYLQSLRPMQWSFHILRPTNLANDLEFKHSDIHCDIHQLLSG